MAKKHPVALMFEDRGQAPKEQEVVAPMTFAEARAALKGEQRSMSAKDTAPHRMALLRREVLSSPAPTPDLHEIVARLNRPR